MGSYYAIVIDSPGRTDAGPLHKEIEGVFASINRQMSTWVENSQISQFNRSSAIDWFAVGKDFAIVAQEAKRIHELSRALLIRHWHP